MSLTHSWPQENMSRSSPCGFATLCGFPSTMKTQKHHSVLNRKPHIPNRRAMLKILAFEFPMIAICNAAMVSGAWHKLHSLSWTMDECIPCQLRTIHKFLVFSSLLCTVQTCFSLHVTSLCALLVPQFKKRKNNNNKDTKVWTVVTG